MSGHSKWSGIKHKKAVVDAQRGKLFSRLTRELIAAARVGGGNPDMNPRLRLAVAKAREGNLPKDSIEKSIKKGTGELPGVSYEEMVMEGYGPGGVAIYIEALTDNKNRTTAELRSIISRNQGSPAGTGSVAWLFEKKGLITLNAAAAKEDRLMEVVLEAGADDLKVEGDQVTVTTSPQKLEAVKQALQEAAIAWGTAEVSMVPSSTVQVSDPAQARSVLALLDVLEEYEDTQHVWSNFDIPDEILTTYASQS